MSGGRGTKGAEERASQVGSALSAEPDVRHHLLPLVWWPEPKSRIWPPTDWAVQAPQCAGCFYWSQKPFEILGCFFVCFFDFCFCFVLFLVFVSSIRGGTGGCPWLWVVKLGFLSAFLWISSEHRPFLALRTSVGIEVFSWSWPELCLQSREAEGGLWNCLSLPWREQLLGEGNPIRTSCSSLQTFLDWWPPLFSVFAMVSLCGRRLRRQRPFLSKHRAGIEAICFLAWLLPGF